MESSKREANSNFVTGDREDVESKDGAENGQNRDQTANHFNTKGDGLDNAQESEAEKAMHFTPVIAGEHKINRPGLRAALALIPPFEELPRLWAKQNSELNVLRAEKKDLQMDLDSLGIRHNEQQEELSDLKRLKNGLEPTVRKVQYELEQCNLENEQLKEQNESLRWKVHEFAAEVGKEKEELSELSRTNDRLLRELKNATDDAREREKTMEALKVEIQKFVGAELGNKVSKVEVDKLNDDLMKAREQIKNLVGQQQETAVETQQNPAAEPGGEGPMSSLEDEMWEARSVQAKDGDKEEEYLPDDLVFRTKATLTSEPVAMVDTTDEVIRTLEPTSTESQDKPEEIMHNSKGIHTGCASGPDAENEAAKAKITTYSQQTLETPVAESDRAPLERYLTEPTLSTVVDDNGPIEPSGLRINSMYVWPSTPRTESIEIDSEPSPLSLTWRSNSFHGGACPGRPLLSSTSEVEASDFDQFRSDSSPPRCAENALEIKKAKLVHPQGPPVQVPRTTISGAPIFDADTWPSLQADKILDLSTRRKRPVLQGWSESRPGDCRLGKAGLPTLDPCASNITSWVALTAFENHTHHYLTQTPDQIEGQSTRGSTTKGNSKEGKCKSSIANTIQYSSVAWWLLLLSLALSWWCSEDDGQLWMQANEATRQNVLGWRDERWAEPLWLGRMSFDVEHMLQIDRPLFV
jgi:hypothetical protein